MADDGLELFITLLLVYWIALKFIMEIIWKNCPKYTDVKSLNDNLVTW